MEDGAAPLTALERQGEIEASALSSGMGSDSAVTAPEELLRAAAARDALETLQLKTIADLIAGLESLYKAKFADLQRVIQALQQLGAQLKELHEMYVNDVAAIMAILRVFQNELIILEPPEASGSLTAALAPPKAKS